MIFPSGLPILLNGCKLFEFNFITLCCPLGMHNKPSIFLSLWTFMNHEIQVMNQSKICSTVLISRFFFD